MWQALKTCNVGWWTGRRAIISTEEEPVGNRLLQEQSLAALCI